jgi:alpha 1,2-mannosyltransferase
MHNRSSKINCSWNENTRARFNRLPIITPLEITPDERLEVLYHDLEGALPNLSTESGQLIPHKGETNGHTLLVSLFYNIFILLAP